MKKYEAVIWFHIVHNSDMHSLEAITFLRLLRECTSFHLSPHSWLRKLKNYRMSQTVLTWVPCLEESFPSSTCAEQRKLFLHGSSEVNSATKIDQWRSKSQVVNITNTSWVVLVSFFCCFLKWILLSCLKFQICNCRVTFLLCWSWIVHAI